MIPVLSVDLMRESDAAACLKIPAAELMFRAGEGMFRALTDRLHPLSSAAVICGSGNNAGDGYVIALLLHDAGVPVTVFSLSGRMTESGAVWAEKCLAAGIAFIPWGKGRDLSGYDALADCIFGIGFSGELKEPAAGAIREINRCGEAGAFVLSADINSGLAGDSGLAAFVRGTKERLCVRSDLTVSVGGFKPGHFLSMAKDVMKEKISLDVGIAPVGEPYGLWEAEDAARAFPPRPNFSNKSDYGYTVLLGGSARYGGAVRLASMACAAVRSGAGVVKTAAPASLCSLIAPLILEATLFPMPERDGELVFDEEALSGLTRGIRSAAFGMGAGLSPETEKIVRWLLTRFDGALVIDADGLNALSRMEDGKRLLRESAARAVILTPHVLEFSRLLGLPRETGVREVLEDPIPKAVRYARETGVTLLLKGPATVITDGERTVIADRGCPGMATAGSGDVLSGVLAAVCGFNRDPLTAAASAAWITGRAGELAEAEVGAVSMVAGDTIKKLPAAILELCGK